MKWNNETKRFEPDERPARKYIFIPPADEEEVVVYVPPVEPPPPQFCREHEPAKWRPFREWLDQRLKDKK